MDQAIENAFQLWSNVTPLTFTKVSEGQADIMISFVRGDHRDNSPLMALEEILLMLFNQAQVLGGMLILMKMKGGPTISESTIYIVLRLMNSAILLDSLILLISEL